MLRRLGRLSSSSSSSSSSGVQPDGPLYEPVLPDRHAKTVRPPPPVPKNPDRRGKNSPARRSCDSPTCEDDAEIQRVRRASPAIPSRPAPSEPVRTDSCSSSDVPLDLHLYEDISELLDDHQDGDVFAAKGKRYSSSSLTESCDFQVKSELLPGWDDLFDVDWKKRENQSRMFAQTVDRIRSGIQLYQHVLFQRGTGMMNYITQLNCIADKQEKTVKNTRIAGITGGTTGAIGTAAIVAGIALAPLTLGVSLAMSGIGVGVAAAGGVTGASAAINKKVKETQVRKKVEKILKSYESQMEDIEECLRFVISGMKHLRSFELSEREVSDDAADVVRLSEKVENCDVIDALSENTRAVQAFASDLDSYFTKEDGQRLKKESKCLFVAKIREVTLKLKENIDHLIHIKNMFR